MLWAIDVGNTHTVVGLWDGQWRAVWRLPTDALATEDQLAAQLKTLCELKGLSFAADGFAVASVVPSLNNTLGHLSQKWLSCEPFFLSSGEQVGLQVRYDPPHAVGADRIANALAALQLGKVPLIVVDFGTATTFDVIDAEGSYIGGIILPGILVSLEALFQKTAKLPQIELVAPKEAIGSTTTGSLQSGATFGYAGAIDALCEKIMLEVGEEATVLTTGGLAKAFLPLCKRLQRYEPNLTLDGVRLAWERAHQGS